MSDQETIVDQPAPMPRENVTSVQALVRADLDERERIGVERYGTPLQPHNGRDALVDAYQEALDLACYLRQALAEGRGKDIIDGDLLVDIIAEACPLVLHDNAARETAERALAALTRVEGVTVTRGMDSKPWVPDREPMGDSDYQRGWREGYGQGRGDEAHGEPVRTVSGEVAS